MKILSGKDSLLLSAGHFATDINHGSLPIILAYLYQHNILTSYSQVALLMMANTILNAIIQPIAGNLSDKKARPYLMSVGIFLAFSGVMFIGFVENIYLLYVLICLNGVGSAIFHPAGGKMSHIIGGKKQGKSMSLFSVGGNAGMAAGPFYFTILYMFFSLKATLALCIPGFIVIAMLLFKNRYYTLKTLHHDNLMKKDKNSTQKENVKGFIYLVAVLFVRSTAWFTFISFISLYFMHLMNVKDETATLINGFICLTGAIATFTGGTFSDKLGYKKLIMICSSMSALCFIGFLCTNTPLFAVLSLLPFAFCFFMSMSPYVVIGQKLLCRHVGMATGFTIGLSMSFGGLMSPLLGKLGDTYGLDVTMKTVAIFIVLEALGALFLPKVENKKQ